MKDELERKRTVRGDMFRTETIPQDAGYKDRQDSKLEDAMPSKQRRNK